MLTATNWLFTYGVHLIVASNVFVEGAQHDHSHHAGEKQDDHKRVHDAVGGGERQDRNVMFKDIVITASIYFATHIKSHSN